MTKLSFTDYLDASKDLFSKIFGMNNFSKLYKQPVKSISWDGVDITTSQILKVYPNLKQRFSQSWLTEEDNMLDLFITSVFHYGYDQCYNEDVKAVKKEVEHYRTLYDEIREDKAELKFELRKYKEKYGKL